SADYEVIVWVAHGNITDETLLDTVTVELTDADREALFKGTGDDDKGDDDKGDDDKGKQDDDKAEKPGKGDDEAPAKKPAKDPSKEVVCTTETVPGQAGSPRLSWGVKSSFVSYIQGGIAKGA